MKAKKDKRGGARVNAGRKPIKDKKKLIALYIQESVIDKVGGEEKTKELATDYIENIAEKYRFVKSK